MAETVTIEIPVSVKDETSNGISSAEESLSSFERSVQKTEQQLSNLDKAHDIDLVATDRASGTIHEVESDANTLDGVNPDIDIGANDLATDVIGQAIDAAEEFDGMEPEAEIDVDDMATDQIEEAIDAAEEFGGMSEEAEISANDSATDTIGGAIDTAEQFGGMSENAEIGAHDSATDVIDSVMDKAEEFGGSVFTASLEIAGSALALLGISSSVGETVTTFENFEAGMSQVEAISGAYGQDLEDLTEKAKEMGATTKFTATEAAEAMNYMAMAGWDAQEMMEGIEGVMNLAAASGESLGTTSDIVTDALTAFGYSASDSGHFADVLAAAASNSNTNVQKMGETFKYAGAMAGTLGYSIEDVAVMTGLMANSGIKGSMAGSALNMMFTRLSTNTNGARDALEDLGIEYFDNAGNARDLSDVIDELRIATADYTDEQKSNLANTIAGTSAQKGLLAILNASQEDYDSLTESINGADGAAESMSETMLDNMQGSLTLMNSALDAVKTSIGESLSPYIKSAAEWITEAAPEIEAALLGVMEIAEKKIGEITGSDEWADADFFGKADIAWDKLVAEPFSEWIAKDGITTISDAIYGLFNNAIDILPGGESASLTSWLSAGLLVFGGSKIIGIGNSIVSALQPAASAITGVATAASGATSVSTFFSGLSSAVPTSALVMGAAVTIGAAIALINGAIDDYNKKVISNNLEEHFGNIEISAQQAAEAAEAILHTEYMVNVELILNQVEGIDQLREDAEAAITSNDFLTYKTAILGVELTVDEQTEYTENVSTFIDDKLQEIEQLPYTAHIAVQTFLGGTEEGQALDEAISQWALDDSVEMTALSESLTQKVEEALSDGIVDVDEAAAIAQLQEKMNSITGKWAQYENEAQLQWLNQEYGSMSGAALTSGSYENMVNALQEQNEANNAEVQEAYTEFVSILAAMEDSGRLGPENGLATYDEYIRQANLSARNSRAQNLADINLAYEGNTMYDTYGDKITSNLEKAAENTESTIASVSSALNQEGGPDVKSIINDLREGQANWSYGNGKTFGLVTNADQANLNSLYELMQPDVEAMQNIIDQYRSEGEAVPQAVMDAYNEAIEIGAAAGDYSASWQAYANSLIESGDEEIVSMLTDENNPLYETLRTTLDEELIEAIDRASAETTSDPISLDDLTVELQGTEVEGIDEWLNEIQGQLDEAGDIGTITAQTDVDFTVTVNKGDTLSEIGEAIGVDWHEIAEYNGIEDPYTIYPDMEIKIPYEGIKVDTGSIGEAVDDTLAEESGETGSTEYYTTVEVKADEVDTEDVVAQAEAETQEAFEEEIPVDGYASITYSEENNASDVYLQAGAELQSAFDTAIPVTAHALITIDYELSNPTANIQFNGGGSGSTTVNAELYGTGGEVGRNGAELAIVGEEGQEFIIPTTAGRRTRGISLWEEAGQALGVIDSNRAVQAYANGGIVGSIEGLVPMAENEDNDDEELYTVDGKIRKTEGGGNYSGEAKASVKSGNSGDVSVNVEFNPVITIEGGDLDEDAVFEVMKERIREVADDLGDEIAEKMSRIFENMPVIEEA